MTLTRVSRRIFTVDTVDMVYTVGVIMRNPFIHVCLVPMQCFNGKDWLKAETPFGK